MPMVLVTDKSSAISFHPNIAGRPRDRTFFHPEANPTTGDDTYPKQKQIKIRTQTTHFKHIKTHKLVNNNLKTFERIEKTGIHFSD
jgi:hypothetical protein